MGQNEIKALLEKFYRGETSIDEENALRKYFYGENIAPELSADKDIFLYQAQEIGELQDLPDLSDEIWNSLAVDKLPEHNKNRKLIFISLRIAASIIILMGSYFIIKNQVFNGEDNVMVTDTYDDPEQAYEHAKETLLYVSAMLNSGTSHLEPIQMVNKETQKLQTISRFNLGLEVLKPIEKYSKVDKYFKQ